MNKYRIYGTVNDNAKMGGISFWVLNGDIEVNQEGKEVYIIEDKEGEKSELVENMPLIVQQYIKQHKVIKA